MHLLMQIIGNIFLWLLLCGMTAWGALAIYFSYLPNSARPVLSVLFALAQLGILFFLRPRGLAYAVFFAPVCHHPVRIFRHEALQ